MAETRISYKTLQGKSVAIRGNDIDTDRIIPARFMKCVTFEGLGAYAFYDVRFTEEGHPKKHPFNEEKNQGAAILIVNKNFGCGSSREHAPQALQKWGIKAIVGESFAEIFSGNCTAMGIPVVTLSATDVEALMTYTEKNPDTIVSIDLVKDRVIAGSLSLVSSMPSAYKNSLVAGTWDSMGVLLENLKSIKETATRLPYVHGY